MSDEKFDLPEKLVPNYKSIINVRNAETRRIDEEHPPEGYPSLTAFCGEDCAECEYYIGKNVERGLKDAGCRGCRAEGGDCDIRICCLMKKIEDCSLCGEFPCDILKQSYIDDGESEDALLAIKEKRDKETSYSEKRRFSYAVWITSGLVFSLAAGVLTGKVWELIVCGLILGAGIPSILYPPEK